MGGDDRDGQTADGTAGASAPPAPWEFVLPEETATEDLGLFLSELLLPGDVVALSGGLGGGKTTLARAVIRELAGDPRLEVPSPTFTLVQPYTARDGRGIIHADLYRLRDPDELVELGFDEMAEDAITLVEWPDRMPPRAGPVLTVDLSLRAEFGPEARFARIDGTGGMRARLDRARAVRRLLDRSGWDLAERALMQGDASSRAYERLTKPDGTSAVLMIAPPRPDGPPVRDGKPYSAIVHLAESVHAFVALDRGLRALGFSAPKIYGEDLAEGLLILEDLGSEPVIEAGAPRPERYAEAVRLLAKLHATPLPAVLPVADGIEHVLPAYDTEALLFETELMPDWYAPAIRNVTLSDAARADFVGPVARGPGGGGSGPAHLDPARLSFSEPDLAARAGWAGAGRADRLPGRRDGPSGLRRRLAAAGCAGRRQRGVRAAAARPLRPRAPGQDPAFDVSAFATAYALLAAQRATKILGIFARLDRRDGKPGYLAHLPRIEGYLARNLAHPALAGLRAWHAAHLPGLVPPPSPPRPEP